MWTTYKSMYSAKMANTSLMDCKLYELMALFYSFHLINNLSFLYCIAHRMENVEGIKLMLLFFSEFVTSAFALNNYSLSFCIFYTDVN